MSKIELPTLSVKINGWNLDTEMATLIASYASPWPPEHPRHFREGLFVTNNEIFFLAGEGGPFSLYAKRTLHPAIFSSGQRIIPLSFYTAQLWADMNGIHFPYYRPKDEKSAFD
jgi:hypothetical protein